jgi:hypothetical protein
MEMTQWPRSGTRTPDTESLEATGDAARTAKMTGSIVGAAAAAAVTTEVSGGSGAHDAHTGLRAACKAGRNVTGQDEDAKEPGHTPTASGGDSSSASRASVSHIGLLQAALSTRGKVPYSAVPAYCARRGDGRPADSCRNATTKAVRLQASSRPPRRRVDSHPTAGDPLRSP